MKKYVFIFGLVLSPILFFGSTVYAAEVCSNGAPTWSPSSPVEWRNGGVRNFSMEQGYSNDWQSIPTPPAPWPNTYSGSCTAAATNGARCSVSCLDKIKYQDFAACPSLEQRLGFCNSPANRIDNVPPTCGSWSGSGPTYTLGVGSDTGNVGGDSGLAPGSTSPKSCTATENSTPTPWTCKIDIYDNALNKTTCTSPSYVPYSCLGSDPSNATICSGDDSGLGNNVAKSIVNACTVPLKCEFTCDSGYQYQNLFGVVSCVPVQYSCTPAADPAHASLCSGDASGLTYNTDKMVVSACTTVNKCEYTCEPGYKVGDPGGSGINSCVPLSGVSCTASHTFTQASIGASESSSEWYDFTDWDTTKFNYTWSCKIDGSVVRSGTLSQNNLTQTKRADGTTFIVGKTTDCTVTATPKAGVTGTGCSASASLTIGASALSCSPAAQTVAELQIANFTATGGSGTLNWSTSGSPYGSPMAGTGNSFSTSYGQCGDKTITVTDGGGQIASCALTVTGASCGGGGGCPVGQTNPYFTCQSGSCTRVNSCGTSSAGCNGGNVGATCGGGTCPSGTFNPHYICSASRTCQKVNTCGVDSGGCNYTNEQMSCGAPQPQIGNILVNSTPDSSWTITGPVNRSGSGDSAEYWGVPTGTYTLITDPGFVVDDAWQTLPRGGTIIFNITGTPSALSCSSNKGVARTGELIDYAASGGSGNFSWSGGGNPATGGNLSSFSTSFATAGNYLVRVTRGADTADCPAVVVSDPPTVSVALSANPVSGMIDLLSRITAVVGGTATGPINYKFWKDCEGASCGTPDATVDSDAVSEYVEFTYTAAKTNHPKVTVIREGLTDSANTIVASTPKKYACASGSCSISAGGAYNSMASCADACMHSECVVPNSCSSVSADPVTGIGGPNRCSSSCDCGDTSPACNPGGGSCNNNLVQDNGETGVDCGGGGCPACIGETKYSCSETSNSCQPAINGAYGDSTCDGKCAATYYSCSGGGCVADSAGQFTSSNCDNRCAVVYGRCSQAQLACVNTSDPSGLDCSADNNCGGTTPSRLECQGSACVVVSDPDGIGNQSGCSSVGQYCGGAGSCSLKVAPPLVSGGQSVKVSWDCVGTPQCSLTRKYEKPNSTTTILQGLSARTKGVYPGAGEPLEKPASSAIYTLSCTDSSANATARVRVSTLVECAPTDPTCKP